MEDGVVVASIVQREGDIEVPLGEDTLVFKAARFFSPDYAPRMTVQEWKHLQEEDLDIRKAVDLLKRNQLLHYRNNRQDTNEFKSLMKSRHHLKLIEGILYRNVQLKHQPKEVRQLVLPKPLRKRMVLACHDEMGHMGMDRVLLLLQDRVFWPGMAKDVRIHIRTCERCERFKTPKDLEEASQTEALYPLELIHVDFLQIGGKERCEEGHKRSGGDRPLHQICPRICHQCTNCNSNSSDIGGEILPSIRMAYKIGK